MFLLGDEMAQARRYDGIPLLWHEIKDYDTGCGIGFYRFSYS